MSPRQNTKISIVLAAIEILKSEGTEGLTLRKVATAANISLGNLQYHYKDRGALMGGIAKHYFDECEVMFEQLRPPDGAPKEQLGYILHAFLGHVDHITDMCRMFRELWSLSTRNEDIHDQLVSYYKVSRGKLTELLIPICQNEEKAIVVASLLIPYFEGYSVTVDSLPQSTEETVELLLQVCCSLANIS